MGVCERKIGEWLDARAVVGIEMVGGVEPWREGKGYFRQGLAGAAIRNDTAMH